MQVSLEPDDLSVPPVMGDPSVAIIVREIALRERSTKNERLKSKTMSLYLSQKRWGRVCLHFVVAMRAGHWGWHLAGIGREIQSIWPQPRLALAYVKG